MSILTVFSGAFCREELVVQDILASTGYRLITDKDVTAEASKAFGIAEDKISRAFSAKTSVFNRFTREKETAISYLKSALVGMLQGDQILVQGFSGLLLPAAVSHVLRVCLIADLKSRVAVGAETRHLSEKEAMKTIRSRDEDCAAWVNILHDRQDPWDASLYDLVIPMNHIEVAKAGAIIEENLLKDVVKSTDHSKAAMADFRLGTEVEVELAREGHNVGVAVQNGEVALTINKHVLMLSRLEDELATIATKVPGVVSVETNVGKEYHRSDVYRKHDFEMPEKVLLVDDEREFVQTLSERLLLRDMGSAVAYDGASALDLVRDDEPEVMIIDLKMPGINGLEVLKQVKASRPEIEVIVLTGHGADADRQQCMALGAFGYLQKPVDIDELSGMLKKAHEKIRQGGSADR